MLEERLLGIESLQELRNSLIALCPNYLGLMGYRSQTDEEYQEFHIACCSTSSSAERLLCREIVKYVLDRQGAIYWRVLPETASFEGEWAGYARLLRSAKAVVN